MKFFTTSHRLKFIYIFFQISIIYLEIFQGFWVRECFFLEELNDICKLNDITFYFLRVRLLLCADKSRQGYDQGIRGGKIQIQTQGHTGRAQVDVRYLDRDQRDSQRTMREVSLKTQESSEAQASGFLSLKYVSTFQCHSPALRLNQTSSLHGDKFRQIRQHVQLKANH